MTGRAAPPPPSRADAASPDTPADTAAPRRLARLRRALAAAWLLLLGGHALGLWWIAPVAALDTAWGDLRTRAFPAPPVDTRLVVVAIDEAALATHGRWPWPRDRLATLLERLAEAGVALTALDVILSEPDAPAADARLAAALAAHPVVLAAQRAGPALPLAAFAAAAAGVGAVDATVDGDGITRHAPLLADGPGGRAAPALSLAAARVLRGDAAEQAARAAVAADGRVRLPFPAAAGRVSTVSAAELLAGQVPAGAWAGRVALVGATATGLGDRHATPVGAAWPGVELHANLLDAQLRGALPREPAWGGWIAAGAVVALGVPWIAARRRPGPGLASATAAAAVAGLLLANTVAWTVSGLALPLAAPLLAVLGLYAGLLAFGQLAEAWKRRRLALLFGEYLPPELVEQMARDPARYSMAPRGAELTVLFSDVRGFTSFSEKLPPPELAALMNRYLTVMTEIVRAHGGTLDKYIGDAIMAFWGAPRPDAAHAEHAVDAALAMQAALPALNAEFAARGWPAIRVTIGVNTGPVVVGDMGSRHRRAYTVMGDVVNVASRLQELSGKLEEPVLIGAATAAQQPPRRRCRPVAEVPIRGREQALAVFAPEAVATATALPQTRG